MEVAQARLSLFMSKCHIVCNHMSGLKCHRGNIGHNVYMDVVSSLLSRQMLCQLTCFSVMIHCNTVKPLIFTESKSNFYI